MVENGTTMGTRIFIDCTAISRRTNITGIPRVTLEYLRAGYAFGREHHVTVVPVSVKNAGLVDCRHKLPRWCSDCPVYDPNLRLSGRAAKYRQARLHRILQLIAGSGRLLFAESRRLLLGRSKSREFGRKLRELRRQARAQSQFALRLEPRPGDILFMPAWWHDVHPSIYHDLSQAGVILVPLVHDALPILMPEHYSTSRWFSEYFVATLSMSSHALYVSKTTKRDVESILEARGANVPKGQVAYNSYNFSHGLDDKVTVRKSLVDLLSTRQFKLLMVGSLEPKKNYEAVLEVCEKLWLKGQGLKLIIFGREGWKFDNLVETISGHPFRDIHLHWIRDASDYELRYAYENCDLYLSSSLGEGFGLPVIEALAHKLPVLISDIEVYREIVGDAAVYFDPTSVDSLRGELMKLFSNPEYIDRLRERAAGFRWQSWEESGASIFRSLYELAPTNAQSKSVNPDGTNSFLSRRRAQVDVGSIR